MATSLALLLSVSPAFAQFNLNPHFTLEEEQKASEHNITLSLKHSRDATKIQAGKLRPFAEYEHTGIVAMSAENMLDTTAMKQAIAEHLPKDVKLLLTVKNFQQQLDVFDEFEHWIDRNRLIFIHTGGKGGNHTFWSRDALPYPVLRTTAPGSTSFELVDAKYYPDRFYEPDSIISLFLNVPLNRHEYIYFGGNLISDTHGNCYRIDSGRGRGVPEEIFRDYYGCTTLTQFPHRGGLGDIDERIKFLSDTEALTDTAQYIPVLQQKGFHVTLLPKPHGDHSYETYANSLLVNGVLFLPTFRSPEDPKAISIYESFGLKVYPVHSPDISNKAFGNVHCYTMNYPDA